VPWHELKGVGVLWAEHRNNEHARRGGGDVGKGGDASIGEQGRGGALGERSEPAILTGENVWLWAKCMWTSLL
jgi:hypothetical protein